MTGSSRLTRAAAGPIAAIGSLLILLCAPIASAQSPGGSIATPPAESGTDTPAAAHNPYLGSASSEPRREETIDLTLEQALDRAMRVNLGLLFDDTASDKAKAARWNALSALVPHVHAAVGESTRRTNLRALGIPVPGLPTTVDVDNSDVRVSVTESLFDAAALAHVHAATASEQASHNDYQQGRETVAVVVANAYLSMATAQSRLEYAKADLETADALFKLATDREHAGLSPEVDTLRAQVEQQARRESVIDASNRVSKRRLALLRLIGLDLHQEIRLSEGPTDGAIDAPDGSTAYQQALKSREDYQAALEHVKAAELNLRAARLERAPRLDVTADYGALGTTPGNAVSTWTAGVAVHVPIFEGGRIGAGVATADAELRNRRAALEDLRVRIGEDVETALLDLESARQQVEVSRAAVDYANRALRQSRDRFAAGVTNNIEVIQAQEALASANDHWVDSLHAWSIARVLLARATGNAEGGVRTLLAQRTPAAPPAPR